MTLFKSCFISIFILCQLLLGSAFAAPLIGVHTENISAIKNLSSNESALRQLGAQVIRLPVTWHLMEESQKGTVPEWFWQELDAEVAASRALNAKLIITFSQTPCWASSDPKKNCENQDWNVLYPPKNMQDYADAIGLMAKRYQGRVLAYEIWNEPNLIYFWHGLPPRTTRNDEYGSFVSLNGAVEYAKMVVAAYRAVKSNDPQAVVLAGSIAGGDTDFLSVLYQNPQFKYSFDAISMHPYTSEYPGDNPKGTRFGPNECPQGAFSYWCSSVSVQRIRKILDAKGQASKKIWFTEFGFSSSRNWNGSESITPGKYSSEQGQALYLKQMAALIKKWGFVPVACWYNLLDSEFPETTPLDENNPDAYSHSREAFYGLFYADRTTLKPSGYAFKNVIKENSRIR
ncbi:MAG TPA: cellulase family glycosylhydrolase [Methylotenera sp.]|nr:cellulase family glycosylhydrolase [Methylotenera sp.]HPH05992.1 cellulase family glycosylhydrolase [Methylotenera sp.]HPN00570.1 cellulase family glycosylhydrolase [Methylotenera sp.]